MRRLLALIPPRLKRALALLLMAAAGLYLLWQPAPSTDLTFRRETITIKSGTRMWPFTVEIAETPKQKRQGLMYRKRLAPSHGMLFLSSGETYMPIWMKNTLIPLDIIFINNEGEIVYIVQSALPFSTDLMDPGRPVRAVLEIAGGSARARGIKLGDQVMHAAFLPSLRKAP